MIVSRLVASRYDTVIFFKKLLQAFPARYRDEQVIFENSVKIRKSHVMKHIILQYRDDIRINKAMLEIAQICRNQWCVCMVVKEHSRECQICSGILENVMHQLPYEIINEILLAQEQL